MDHYRVSRGSQFQVEDLFAPSTFSPANEMMASEKVVYIKEVCNCDDKPLISNLPSDTVMENNNTTQEKASPVQYSLLLLKPSQVHP